MTEEQKLYRRDSLRLSLGRRGARVPDAAVESAAPIALQSHHGGGQP